MSMIEFGEEVATSDVLTIEEIGVVCQSIGKKKKPRDLCGFSNETKPRTVLRRYKKVQTKIELSRLKTTYTENKYDYNFTLHTKHNSIELLPLMCTNHDQKPHRFECTTTITKDPDSEPPIQVTCRVDVEGGAEFAIPLAVDGRNITLQPNTKYRVRMELSGQHKLYYSKDNGSYENDQLILDITKKNLYYDFPSAKLEYNVLYHGV